MADWFWYILPIISLGVVSLGSIGVMMRAYKRADDFALEAAKLRGENAALRRFIGCKCKAPPTEGTTND